ELRLEIARERLMLGLDRVPLGLGARDPLLEGGLDGLKLAAPFRVLLFLRPALLLGGLLGLALELLALLAPLVGDPAVDLRLLLRRRLPGFPGRVLRVLRRVLRIRRRRIVVIPAADRRDGAGSGVELEDAIDRGRAWRREHGGSSPGRIPARCGGYPALRGR